MKPLFPTDRNVLLPAQLEASRARSTHLTSDLDGERLLGPPSPITNPPLWEIGHLAWFQEYWCLRQQESGAVLQSILPNADALYDSAKVAHDTRWNLPLPTMGATRAYQADVMGRVLERLIREPENEKLHYFVWLAVAHDDMHAEAFYYTRQTLHYSNPFPAPPHVVEPGAGATGDVSLAGGSFRLGAEIADGFVFDNEKWAHEVQIAPFRIARTPVTNAEYADFVEAAGYVRREFWDDEGWAWREQAQLQAPRYWIRQASSWALNWFDETIALTPRLPVVNVNWHEAQAYCRFAQRRLPTEAEWEYAAAWDPAARRKRRYPWGDSVPAAESANLESPGLVAVDAYPRGDSAAACRQMMGNVWEWTASNFEAYPGFVVDPYKEYSQPWFGTHKVLRGGSFATTRRLMRNTWRNFYTPRSGRYLRWLPHLRNRPVT